MIASGIRMHKVSNGNQGDPPVQPGQTVRANYIARTDDGTEIARASASCKQGGKVVCEAIDEGVVGMCVGDHRRLRAPPYAHQGRAVQGAPKSKVSSDI